MLQNVLTNAQTKNTQANTAATNNQVINDNIKTKLLTEENMREWDHLNIEERKVKVQELLGGVIEDNALWNNISGSIDKWMKMPVGGNTHTPIKGFGR